MVSVYRTKLMGRYVVTLGTPLTRMEALALAADARTKNLGSDAFTAPAEGWEHVGVAPFPVDVRSAAVP